MWMGEFGTLVKALDEFWTAMRTSREEMGRVTRKGIYVKVRWVASVMGER